MTHSQSIDSNQNPIPKARFTGIFIPVEILELDGISTTEIILLSWIDALYCKDHGGCFASNDYIAKKLNLSEKHVSDLLAKLIVKGLIEKVKFDGRTRVIRACKERWFKVNEPESDSGKIRTLHPEKTGSDSGKNRKLTNIYSKEESKDIFTEYGSYVKMPKEKYEELCIKHSKSKVDEIIESMNDHCVNNRPQGYRDYVAAFRTFLKNYKPPINIPAKQSNIDFVKEKFIHGRLYNGAECFLDNIAVGFQRGQNHGSVKFNDLGFKEQFENMLRKFEIHKEVKICKFNRDGTVRKEE